MLVGVVAASPSAHKISFVFAAVWKPQIHFELLGSSTVLMERSIAFQKKVNNLRRLRRLKVSRP